MEKSIIHFESVILLRKKAMILAGIIVLISMGYLTVQHFFYFLNSYIYTAEFHWLFMVNNLKAGNIPLMTEYFKTLGPIACIPNLLLAHGVNTFFALLSWPALAESTITAFGPGVGIILTWAGTGLISLCAFGLGIFFLGDIWAIIGRRLSSHPEWEVLIPVSLLCVPYVTTAIPALSAAFFRIRFKTFIPIMAFSLCLRMVWV